MKKPFLRLLLMVAGLLLLTLALAAPAFASAPVDAKPPPTITLDAISISFLVGFVLPFLTALVTKVDAHSGLKGAITLLLSGVAGTIAVLTTNAGKAITVKELVLAIGAAWIMAVGSHFGLWKPTGATPAVNRTNVGIGPPAAKAA